MWPYFQELIQTAQRLQSQVSYSHLLVLIQLSPSVPSIHFNGFTVHAFDFLSKMSPLLTSRTSEQGSTVSCERRARGGLRSLGSLGSLPSLPIYFLDESLLHIASSTSSSFPHSLFFVFIRSFEIGDIM